MVHHRINDPDVKPNPHINFISALPNHRNPEDSQNAVEYLRALAAQVKPIMKAHGFAVNSLEEYEHNSVFLGRNWNNGETIELVLRNASGRFMPSHCLMSTLCHELAHILHMNHGPDFQALWRKLNSEVIALQNKGYYGDGFWSSGTRLADSGRVGGSGIEPGDLPEYICGGAQRTSRPVRPRGGPRGPRRKTVPSNHTGRQTEIPRKAGTRVKSAYSFTGKGEAVDADNAVHGVGTGFGKRAQSNRAREERALAAERRMAALQRQKQEDESKDLPTGSESESDIEQVEIPETDQERRQALLDSMDSEGENMESMKLCGRSLEDFEMGSKNFVFAAEKPGESSTRRKQDLLSGNIGGRSSGLQADRKGKRKATDDTSDDAVIPTKRAKQPSATTKGRIQTISTQTRPSGSRSSTIILKPPAITSRREDSKSKYVSGLANLVQTEVKIRKAEAPDMEPVKGGGYTLGASDAPGSSTGRDSREDGDGDEDDGREWSCHICTLLNEPQHLACSACATPRRWNIK